MKVERTEALKVDMCLADAPLARHPTLGAWTLAGALRVHQVDDDAAVFPLAAPSSDFRRGVSDNLRRANEESKAHMPCV